MSNKQDSSIDVIESWKHIQHHFFEREGLIGQIERGESVKFEEAQEVRMALTVIHDAWGKQRTVPRQQVLLLWNAVLRLEQVLTNKVQNDQEDLLALVTQLRNQLETIFDDPLFPMREERAMEVLLQHIIGGPSFGLQLRQGYVNTSFFHNLVLQIEKLKKAWEGKEEIAKRGCGALFAVEHLSWPSRTSSEKKMQELAGMKQNLYEQINACLYGDQIEEKEEQE
ncbi:MAG: hypothetical protein JO031_08880 [Ktedonobacteraceae bacterium]|nr:hypothetical protein [Ktedonobacteraceae bacterium]